MSRFYLPERGVGRIVGVLLYVAIGVGLYFFAMWLKPYIEGSTPGQIAWMKQRFGETGTGFIVFGGIGVLCITMILILRRDAKRSRGG